MRQNPILPGFNPEPSVCRVGDDYYVATATFQWFPGVQIHHSCDLSNWHLKVRPLARASQLDLRGGPDPVGVIAPSLTHADGRFWLVYTQAMLKPGLARRSISFVVTANDIMGPWSDPIRLHQSGYACSLFHDDDQRSWLVQMSPDPKRRSAGADRIAIQEFDRSSCSLIGAPTYVAPGMSRGNCAAPRLIKRNGWYHLLIPTTEPDDNGAVTSARSRKRFGPYQAHPEPYLLMSGDGSRRPVRSIGGGDLVETANGQTYLVHHLVRLNADMSCGFGAETGIQACEWRDDWLFVKAGPTPAMVIDLPMQNPAGSVDTVFADGLPPDFQWLQSPHPERWFETHKGTLVLLGRDHLASWGEKALVARRQTDLQFRVETTIEFAPTNQEESAGLALYTSPESHVLFAMTANSRGERVVRITTTTRGHDLTTQSESQAIPAGALRLAVTVQDNEMQFHWAEQGESFRRFGPAIDANVLCASTAPVSAAQPLPGAFVGLFAVDMNGKGKRAKFSSFSYLPD